MKINLSLLLIYLFGIIVIISILWSLIWFYSFTFKVNNQKSDLKDSIKNEYPRLGKLCKNNNDCSSDENCQSNLCIKNISLLKNGENCISNNQCFSNLCQKNTFTCVSNLNQSCNSNSECADNLVCNNNVCVTNGLEGSICFMNEDCENGLVCVNQTCEKIGNGRKGSICNTNNDCIARNDDRIMNNLICMNNVCQEQNSKNSRNSRNNFYNFQDFSIDQNENFDVLDLNPQCDYNYQFDGISF